ncbi:phosphoribosylformylglycinamidine synthase subunit PurQ [Schleiferia thermophila]|uniref:Phosphoribosylformylglycinamidine synthase subunit PurQ n=1 Tax=Schleiferia thermophila TaxID=884107 RepID=A0A369A5Z3_9FLAO|nr:phosphoribosylformylglycinamidine synthase subunit PurQ [Schleiferia thermophila]RCX04760.1 phosphoribosylformylglycinamidine synthase subunit I [Schleiferia thermophila]GCD79711.1 phosphoribosylformylglycinamidine synthase subunit PurQ [Schleiferia thermophila]
MKFGVVVFPGSNCDEDMVYVLKNILGQQVVKLWHKDHNLQGVDMIVLPGGFSYGDYLRSGAIAKFSPIMNEVTEFAKKGGYVLGVCNGFQILCEAQLLPGTLIHNTSHRFICKNQFIVADNNVSPINASIPLDRVLNIPIAHGEGCYYADVETIKEIEDNAQVLFRYCNPEGHITEDANPNGSVNNIAGVTNIHRNVFGMMPHPERAADEELGNTDGRLIFESLLNHMMANV